jgi:hypothetical protein
MHDSGIQPTNIYTSKENIYFSVWYFYQLLQRWESSSPDVVLYDMLSSLGTFVHVVNHALVVLEQLRPFLFVCWSDQVAIHIKGHWFEVYIFDEFKTFELRKQVELWHEHQDRADKNC